MLSVIIQGSDSQFLKDSDYYIDVIVYGRSFQIYSSPI